MFMAHNKFKIDKGIYLVITKSNFRDFVLCMELGSLIVISRFQLNILEDIEFVPYLPHIYNTREGLLLS